MQKPSTMVGVSLPRFWRSSSVVHERQTQALRAQTPARKRRTTAARFHRGPRTVFWLRTGLLLFGQSNSSSIRLAGNSKSLTLNCLCSASFQVIDIDRPDVNSQVAVICTPQIPSPWTDTDYVMRRLLNPVCHAIAIICLLLVGIVHFVLPQLRDLIGNMITTLGGCMIVARIANVVRIFVEYNSPISYFVAGTDFCRSRSNICCRIANQPRRVKRDRRVRVKTIIDRFWRENRNTSVNGQRTNALAYHY